MNVLLLASHAVAEYDDIRMLTDLGYDVFCPGGYQDPANPAELIRPALPDVPVHRDLIEACEVVRRERGDPGDAIDWAKAHIPDTVLDWCDVIIVHHFPERWIGAQWDRIKHKRVIWRTCGQSNPQLELMMRPLRSQGLEIVRYSPKEAEAFSRFHTFAGEDALIRFGKYPSDWTGWIGDDPIVINIAQHDRVPHGRDEFLNWSFWERATARLNAHFYGPNSELIGGGGELAFYGMQLQLRHARAYLYTGTQPASYTLGLIEAMMTGIPTFSIGPMQMVLPTLFEAHEITDFWSDNTVAAHKRIGELLVDDDAARAMSKIQRAEAIRLFSVENVGPQWMALLGTPVGVAV